MKVDVVQDGIRDADTKHKKKQNKKKKKRKRIKEWCESLRQFTKRKKRYIVHTVTYIKGHFQNHFMRKQNVQTKKNSLIALINVFNTLCVWLGADSEHAICRNGDSYIQFCLLSFQLCVLW